ncbi:MAG: ankyrin repeat domain-containing protein, partial [Sphingobium phenoxybenzoativorans]
MQQFKGRRSSAIRAAGAALAALMLTVPSIAPAQFSDSYNFLKAVKDRDGDKATTALNKPGSTIVNTRDVTTGETALHIVIARRDVTWLGFLLGKGANPNLADNRGETPLLSAVQLRFIDGVRYLLGNGAQVDKPNDNGETALIRYTLDLRGAGRMPDAAALDDRLVRMMRGWSAAVEAALVDLAGAGRAARLALRHASSFPVNYRNAFTPEEAAQDVLRIA